MLNRVVVLVSTVLEPFSFGVLSEVFGTDRSDSGLPVYDYALCAAVPGPVRTLQGYDLSVPHGLERLAGADLVCVPAGSTDEPVPDEVLDALQGAVAEGARVLSLCTGAFVLGAAGLLDDRECTTHWRHAEELARRFPTARVNPDVLYVDAGQVLTSAGTAAGIDACLHVIRQENGALVANAIARRMVVPAHREGGQAQYIETSVPTCSADTLQPLITWISANLDQEMTVASLADRAAMSPRTFARRFKAETGTTPHQWITAQRLLLAEQLLERECDRSVEWVAQRSGFGNASALRHHFTLARGITPQAYRRTFARVSA